MENITEGYFVLIRHSTSFYRCPLCHLMKATQQKSPRILDVKTVNKDNRCVAGNVHNEKEYSSSDESEDGSDKQKKIIIQTVK